MKPLSPSAERICDVAVGHFAANGYDASSLTEIAAEVGIRKASIYAHFSGKDALFLKVFERSMQVETLFAEQCFAEEAETAQTIGYVYCVRMAEHYAGSAHFRFLLRAAYLPTNTVSAALVPGYKVYLDKLHSLFRTHARRFFPDGDAAAAEIAVFAEAYLGLTDSLHGELLYSDMTSFDRRLTALWRVFTDSFDLACKAASASGGPVRVEGIVSD